MAGTAPAERVTELLEYPGVNIALDELMELQ